MSKDLLVVREYEFNGIKVWVKIDALKKQVSLVEPERSDSAFPFKPKRWLFAERELEYMNGWLNVLDAMAKAVEKAKQELETIKDNELQEVASLAAALSGPAK